MKTWKYDKIKNKQIWKFENLKNEKREYEITRKYENLYI